MPAMNLLAFELSTEACSVAVFAGGEVRERHEIAPRKHAEYALPWAEALLAEAGIAKSALDGVAVGRGPGAFTGVRLGISIAQGIALALDVPAVPVSTLRALAMRACYLPPPPAGEGRGGGGRHAGAGDRVLAAIDARMREVYVARFRLEAGADGLLDAIADGDEAVMPPDAVPAPDGDGPWFGVGTGFGALDGVLRQRFADRLVAVDAEALPHAADVARLAAAALRRGEGIAPERLEPAYLRNAVALTLAEQQALRASRA
jgi:tRNA threonylcarbamoyladenosine biosynthesis protein TsaB